MIVDMAIAAGPLTAIDAAARSGLLVVPQARSARVLVRHPELAELRAFCAAVDMGSISGAARTMRVSQPALSKRLRGLESLVGTPLLRRSTRGVTPTVTGARVYDAARRLLVDAEMFEAVMSGVGGISAPVRLAVSPTIAESWLT